MSLVLTSVTDGVGTLTLNNPDERNTLTGADGRRRSSPPSTRSRPTSRSGRSSSPARRRRSAPAPTSATCATADGSSLGNVYEGFLRVARSPLPTLAAVNGAAVGAGMNMALGCDVRIAARRARFDTRFLQIGIHPGGGHTWMLRRIAGPQTTMAAVLFGEVLDGAEAERVGPRAPLRRRRRPAAAGPGDGGEGGVGAARAADPHQGDDPGDGRRSATTRPPSIASCTPSCGARSSRGSRSASPPCRRRSRRRSSRRRARPAAE